MPRPLRAEEPGATYHVTIHSVDGGVIVRGDDDRTALVEMMGDVVQWQGWVCLAYCVLDTHYHLLVTTPQTNLAEGMRLLNGKYAQQFNRRYGRRGHLFRERYRPTRIAGDAHLLLTIRYIARNAVEAGINADPCAYPWSSYPGVVGVSRCYAFVARAEILGHVGSGAAAVDLLREFVEGTSEQDARAA